MVGGDSDADHQVLIITIQRPKFYVYSCSLWGLPSPIGITRLTAALLLFNHNVKCKQNDIHRPRHCLPPLRRLRIQRGAQSWLVCPKAKRR